MHREEFEASAVDWIIKPVTPAGGGTGAVMADGIIYGITCCLSACIDDQLVVDVLQIVISSDGRSVFTTAGGN
jgi:hypothetical protein